MQHTYPQAAGHAVDPQRLQFIKKAYSYLCFALVAFALLSAFLTWAGVGSTILGFVSGGQFRWLGLIGGLMVVGWIASYLADNVENHSIQVLGLGLYTVAEAIMFSPLFALASSSVPGAIGAAVFITLILVAALSWTAFTSKSDFSFLRGFLFIGGMVALGAIVAGAIFGFSLGVWFSAAMVLFAGCCVLYDTAQIRHHYPIDRPAGAALHLFASIMLLLWYVLRVLMSIASSDD